MSETPSSYTVVISGPEERRSPVLTALKRAGCNLGEQPERGVRHGLPSEKGVGWVTVLAEDLKTVEKVLARSGGWVLRLHWPTPACRACEGHGQGKGGSACLHCLGVGRTNRPYEPPDRITELEDRLAKLEGGQL